MDDVYADHIKSRNIDEYVIDGAVDDTAWRNNPRRVVLSKGELRNSYDLQDQ